MRKISRHCSPATALLRVGSRQTAAVRAGAVRRRPVGRSGRVRAVGPRGARGVCARGRARRRRPGAHAPPAAGAPPNPPRRRPHTPRSAGRPHGRKRPDRPTGRRRTAPARTA
ncbi:hypothetical protein AB1399_02085, partial [Hydrogenibacillus schlegelii]|uniref:hypothetical protein n=1 Tax=Hydrogenibacillus schlegelii TaxID=1484 RepID=UPI0034AE1617